MVLGLSLSFFFYGYGQKVGVVLSGGGAGGLAHIGFLKALEENDIPIDYITGSSIGALIGGLYASGYSPDEIEEILSSQDVKLWSSGKIDENLVHSFKKNPDDASWIRLKLTPTSPIELNLPTNIVNSTSLDFGLAELFARSNAEAGGNFDSLFIPFRCLSSDINSKKSVKFSEGDLATAIRASMSYPFYLNPVKMDGKLLYDGGLYNNFPVSTLCKEFEPDFIIGCNVSYNFPKPDEDNLLSQLRSMTSTQTEYNIECEKGIVIEPSVNEIGILDFDHIQEVIQEGYEATTAKMDSLKASITIKRTKKDIDDQRKKYKLKEKGIQIVKIEISGLEETEEKYIIRTLRFQEGDTMDFEEAKAKVLKLASDEKIKRIYPVLSYSEADNGYTLMLKIKREKKLSISFGGIISTSVINEGFVSLQLNHLSARPWSLYGNTYFGRFYNSGLGNMKVDFPTIIPFQIHAGYTFNKWDYSLNASILSESSAPSFLIQRENFGQMGIGFPISYKGKLDFGANMGDIRYEYYQDNNFTRFDTTDVTHFTNYNLFTYYERNALNQKQYPNQGSLFSLRFKYVEGREMTEFGESSLSDSTIEADHQWLMVKIKYDKYFNKNHKLKFGVLFEGVYSDQPFFSNYANTIMAAPAFEPIPESKIIFRSRFRAHQWAAVGLKSIYSPFKNFDIRLEGFMFQPNKQINFDEASFIPYYDDTQVNRYFIGSFTLLYNLNITHIAINLNYYDNFGDNFPSSNSENYSIMFHLGFVLFNPKMIY